MPRQPYLPNFAHLDYAVGADVLSNHDHLCAAIGKCIALWSGVENEVGNLFGILMGVNSAATLELFLLLRRTSNQIEALTTMSKHALSDKDQKLFDILIKKYKSLESERNSLAHGCFGVASNDPDALLWISIKDHVHFQTDILSKMATGASIDDPHQRLRENMYVYKTTDLQSLYSEMQNFWRVIKDYNSYLRFPANFALSHAKLESRIRMLN